MKRPHEELNLVGLLYEAANTDPIGEVVIHYDPLPHHFFINTTDTLNFFLPKEALFIYQGMAKDVPFGIETFISDALRKFKKEDQV